MYDLVITTNPTDYVITRMDDPGWGGLKIWHMNKDVAAQVLSVVALDGIKFFLRDGYIVDELRRELLWTEVENHFLGRGDVEEVDDTDYI